MNEETKLEIAKLSVQLTEALLTDAQSHLSRFAQDKRLDRSPAPMAVFDAVYAHLADTITKE